MNQEQLKSLIKFLNELSESIDGLNSTDLRYIPIAIDELIDKLTFEIDELEKIVSKGELDE